MAADIASWDASENSCISNVESLQVSNQRGIESLPRLVRSPLMKSGFVVIWGYNGSSQLRLCSRSSYKSNFARMTTGDIKPSGSNIWATSDKMSRFVSFSGGESNLDEKITLSSWGIHFNQSILVMQLLSELLLLELSVDETALSSWVPFCWREAARIAQCFQLLRDFNEFLRRVCVTKDIVNIPAMFEWWNS